MRYLFPAYHKSLEKISRAIGYISKEFPRTLISVSEFAKTIAV